MLNNWIVLDRIEQAATRTPFCPCGQPTSPISRDDSIWLECVTLSNPDDSLIGRLLSSFVPQDHVRQPIVEELLPAAA